MLVLGVLSSPARSSVTRAGFAEVEQQLKARNVPWDLVDLIDGYPELQDTDLYDDPPADSQTARLRARCSRATGVILGSPVYHGSYSGRLKNALDQLEGDAFAGLPVGLLAAGGGPRSASVACDHLRSVVRAMEGWSVPTHVGLSGDDVVDGRVSEDVSERVASMIEEMLRFTLRPLLTLSEKRDAG